MMSSKSVLHHLLCAVAFVLRWVWVLSCIAMFVVAGGIIIWQAAMALNMFGPMTIVYAVGLFVGVGAVLMLFAWAFWMKEKC